MSSQSSGSSGAGSGASSGSAGGAAPTAGSMTPAPSSPQKPSITPITQQKRDFREHWPIWAKQLPRLQFNEPDPHFQLIDKDKLDQVLAKTSPKAAQKIRDDMDFLDREVMRLFRDRDYEAARMQNAYRLLQIGFIVLATAATITGSVQALMLNSRPDLVPFISFVETFIALAAAFLAAISGREPPLPIWLNNRRRAESMRREYFRFLMDLPPYDTLDGYQRRMMAAKRAADINRGVFPDDGQVSEGGNNRGNS